MEGWPLPLSTTHPAIEKVKNKSGEEQRIRNLEGLRQRFSSLPDHWSPLWYLSPQREKEKKCWELVEGTRNPTTRLKYKSAATNQVWLHQHIPSTVWNNNKIITRKRYGQLNQSAIITFFWYKTCKIIDAAINKWQETKIVTHLCINSINKEWPTTGPITSANSNKA